jgi:hypothetical protein
LTHAGYANGSPEPSSASLTVAADDQAAERLAISLNRLNEIVLGEAGHHGRHGAAVLAASENVAAAVDAAAG